MNLKHTLTAVAAALSLAGAAQAATLTIVPSSTSVAVGGSVSVNLVLSGLDAIGQIASGYDLNIAYNTALLSWNVITNQVDPLGGLGNVMFGFDVDDSDGKIGGDATSFLTDPELDALQGDSVTLMSFTFTALADGAAFINFGADPDFERLVTGRLDQFGIAQVLDLTYQGTCIAIGTGDCNNRVPEPESYGLAAIALLGAGLARRRQVVKKV